MNQNQNAKTPPSREQVELWAEHMLVRPNHQPEVDMIFCYLGDPLYAMAASSALYEKWRRNIHSEASYILLNFLIRMLARHAENQPVVEGVCWILEKVTESSMDAAWIFGEKDGFRTLVNILNGHDPDSDPDVIQFASGALANLTRNQADFLATSVVEHAHGVSVLLKVLRSCRKYATIVSRASQALENITFHSKSTADTIVQEHGVDILIDVLRDQRNDQNTLRFICGVLANVTCYYTNTLQAEAVAATMANEGVVAALLTVIRTYVYKVHDVTEKACRVLANLTHNNADLAASVANQAHSLGILFRVLHLYRTFPEVVLPASRALLDVTFYRADTADTFVKEGGVHILINVLRAQFENPEALSSICGMLVNVTSYYTNTNTAATVAATMVNVVPALLNVLSVYVNVRDVTEKACSALANLVHNNPSLAKTLADLDGGVSVLLNVLRSHSKSPDVARPAGRALVDVTFYRADTADRIVQEGGVDILIEVLDDQCEDPNTLNSICGVLANVTFDYTNRNTAEEVAATMADVVAALLKVLEAHFRMKDVTEKACHALENLTHDNADLATFVADHDSGVSVLLTAVHIYANSADVVFLASRVLENITYYTDHKAGTIVRGEGVTILDTAAYTFLQDKGVKILITALRYQLEDPEALRSICGVLANLTCDYPHTAQAIVDLGGQMVLVNVLRKHASQPAVIKQACVILANITCHCQDKIGDMVRGAIVPALLNVLHENMNFPDVVPQICITLAHISCNVCRTQKLKIPVDLNGMDALRIASVTYLNDHKTATAVKRVLEHGEEEPKHWEKKQMY
jgi:hypothetical protein